MEVSSQQKDSLFIKKEALKLGFLACGIARAEKLSAYEKPLKSWLAKGLHGNMAYMENHLEKRLDPRLLVSGARSVIVVALNYFPLKMQCSESPYIVSKYAYGKDYHFIVKEKLNQLSEKLKERIPGYQGRFFSDSAPILERAWAVKAGLGWIGKNGCLIIPRIGSFFFLGELITNVELESDPPFDKDLCGNCTRCLEVCSTGALYAPGRLDARKCISYLTIENKDPVPESFRGRMKGRIFGCDICQDVCPFNRFAKPSHEEWFSPLDPILNWDADAWETMDQDTFNREISKALSPMSRAGFRKIKENISAAGKTDMGC